MFAVEIGHTALEEIATLSAYYGRMILDAIEEHLTRDPTRETRKRKPLAGIEPPFDAIAPIWELRVGDYRVFYDVDLQKRTVSVRAIRRKPPHKTTKEIL